eukprot:131079-Prymnesium_polylepis.1
MWPCCSPRWRAELRITGSLSTDHAGCPTLPATTASGGSLASSCAPACSADAESGVAAATAAGSIVETSPVPGVAPVDQPATATMAPASNATTKERPSI